MADNSPPTEPAKVAILGGGCGGLAAAWSLTQTPELRARFEVTVYQLGWQLGGKGASGRAAAQADGGRRIHEHGLHIWFGFYAHAFRMLRDAYEVAGLATGDEWWKAAFEKCDSVSLYEQRQDGTWLRQPVGFPRRGNPDRGPPTGPARTPLSRVLARTTRLLATGLRSELGQSGVRRGPAAGDQPALGTTLSTLDELASELDQAESAFDLGASDPSRRAVRGVGAAALLDDHAKHRSETITRLTRVLLANTHELASEVQKRRASDRLHFWAGVLELVGASLAGMIADDVLWRGFAPLDDEDLRDWLRRHGAADETVTNSPILRGLYDLTFAYRHGNKDEPSLAAGKGLQSLLMMVNYEGSFMWRMRAGMGDTVFAPLYLALKQRGVRFRFFARVADLRLTPGKPEIGAIDYVQQRTVLAGDDRYDPVELIGGWWCWPELPYEDQLGAGERRLRTIRRGTDFDEVVLAIPVGALPEICPELSAASPRFSQMLAGSETVRTKAMQLWLTKSIGELRGVSDSARLDPPATAYAEPFDTYCDMSHLIEVEGFSADGGPRSVAYFCAVLPDRVAADDAEEVVRADAVKHLEQEAAAFWPDAFEHGAFDWNVLFDPLERVGRDRLGAQYVRANVTATDRYVTTPAGSVDSRLDPERSGFENLVLAGDWTHSGIDGGCVEAAVISGERAATALIERRRPAKQPIRPRGRYVEYGALATAPGPLVCERARLYCFVVRADRARVQQLCDRVLKQPTGGALRYYVPRFPPVILSFGTIAGLRSLHADHSGRGSASEPEAAIWIPTVAQRMRDGRYEDQHLAIFMPYIWVDDPIAFASGREVYGFPKTQGWMRRLSDPRGPGGAVEQLPDPPAELVLDVYGAERYGDATELGRLRLMTVTRRRARRGGPDTETPDRSGEGADLESLLTHVMSELDPSFPDLTASAVVGRSGDRGTRSSRKLVAQLLSQQAIAQVFLKQIRDARYGELAVLQQIIEARSTVTPGTFKWRRLRGAFDLSVASLATQPVEEELGLVAEQTIRLAFVAEFGFRMEPGEVSWPDG